VNLGEPKEGTLGKGLVPFGEDSWGWETREWRVFVSNLSESCDTKREDP